MIRQAWASAGELERAVSVVAAARSRSYALSREFDLDKVIARQSRLHHNLSVAEKFANGTTEYHDIDRFFKRRDYYDSNRDFFSSVNYAHQNLHSYSLHDKFLQFRLDKSNAIAQRDSAYEFLRKAKGMVTAARRELTGEAKLEADAVALAAARRRTAEYDVRLAFELSYAQRYKWFVLFQTLTVEDKYYREVFAPGSSAWRKYRQMFERMINKSCGEENPSEVPTGKNLRFFCVEERGGKGGRLHLHILWICRNLPSSWKNDPNSYKTVPLLREIPAAKGLWKYGFGPTVAVRYSGDAFSCINWRMPVVKKDGKYVVPNASLGAIKGYLLKYVTKDVANPSKQVEECRNTRVRMSRRFGARVVLQWMDRLTGSQVSALSRLVGSTALGTLVRRCAILRRVHACARRKPALTSKIVSGPMPTLTRAYCARPVSTASMMTGRNPCSLSTGGTGPVVSQKEDTSRQQIAWKLVEALHAEYLAVFRVVRSVGGVT